MVTDPNRFGHREGLTRTYVNDLVKIGVHYKGIPANSAVLSESDSFMCNYLGIQAQVKVITYHKIAFCVNPCTGTY